MYEVSVQTSFVASHQLRLHDGNLEPVHSHDWRAEAHWVGPQLDNIAVLVDFRASKAALKEAVADLRDRMLNDVPALKECNPSAEHVARLLYERLAERWPPPVCLAWVRVQEAPGCLATYHP